MRADAPQIALILVCLVVVVNAFAGFLPTVGAVAMVVVAAGWFLVTRRGQTGRS
ncbi:MAG: hypothetical protein ACT452_12535 [Microthrixaceae bacterium]